MNVENHKIHIQNLIDQDNDAQVVEWYWAERLQAEYDLLKAEHEKLKEVKKVYRRKYNR